MSDLFVKNYTALTDEQKTQVAAIKDKAEELVAVINNPTSNIRLMEMSKEHLEISVMLAVKAVTNP